MKKKREKKEQKRIEKKGESFMSSEKLLGNGGGGVWQKLNRGLTLGEYIGKKSWGKRVGAEEGNPRLSHEKQESIGLFGEERERFQKGHRLQPENALNWQQESVRDGEKKDRRRWVGGGSYL